MIRVIFLCDEAGAWKVNFFYIFLVLVTVLYQIALKIISSQTNLLAASLMSHSLDFLTATVSPHYHVTASLHHSWVTLESHLSHSFDFPTATASSHYHITCESLIWLSHHHHITASPHHHVLHHISMVWFSPLHDCITTALPTSTSSQSPCHHIISIWYDFPHHITTSLCHFFISISFIFPTTSLCHHITLSQYLYISTSSQYGMIFHTTLTCHCITVLPCHLNMVRFSPQDW